MSNDGIDNNFSREGLWGRASYFAATAKYSDSYRHSLKDGSGHYQMFVAKVIVGNSIFLENEDRNLTHPPFLEGSTFRRYDSVRARTGETDIYMVYS
jgi:hypothetical protein